jgi:DNA end-binding protein Ku
VASTKMTLSFGLVSVPVRISPAARNERASFHLLHTDCHSRINMKTWCNTCEKEISRSQTVKGFEVEKNVNIVITDEDLKPLEPESSKVIEITAAVNASEVDPLLLDSSYYLEPEPAGVRGYKLILTALEKEGKAAVAKITMHGSEQVIIIRPVHGVLVFHTMFYADEIRPQPATGDVEIKAAELKLARQLLNVNTELFDHAKYSDDYRTSVLALIEAKKLNAPVPVSIKGVKTTPILDIMDALIASIASKTKVKKSA